MRKSMTRESSFVGSHPRMKAYSVADKSEKSNKGTVDVHGAMKNNQKSVPVLGTKGKSSVLPIFKDENCHSFNCWLVGINNYFEGKYLTEFEKFETAVSCLRGLVLLWYQNLKLSRFINGKKTITSWSRLQIHMREKYLPSCEVSGLKPKLEVVREDTLSNIADSKTCPENQPDTNPNQATTHHHEPKPENSKAYPEIQPKMTLISEIDKTETESAKPSQPTDNNPLTCVALPSTESDTQLLNHHLTTKIPSTPSPYLAPTVTNPINPWPENPHQINHQDPTQHHSTRQKPEHPFTFESDITTASELLQLVDTGQSPTHTEAQTTHPTPTEPKPQSTSEMRRACHDPEHESELMNVRNPNKTSDSTNEPVQLPKIGNFLRCSDETNPTPPKTQDPKPEMTLHQSSFDPEPKQQKPNLTFPNPCSVYPSPTKFQTKQPHMHEPTLNSPTKPEFVSCGKSSKPTVSALLQAGDFSFYKLTQLKTQPPNSHLNPTKTGPTQPQLDPQPIPKPPKPNHVGMTCSLDTTATTFESLNLQSLDNTPAVKTNPTITHCQAATPHQTTYLIIANKTHPQPEEDSYFLPQSNPPNLHPNTRPNSDSKTKAMRNENPEICTPHFHYPMLTWLRKNLAMMGSCLTSPTIGDFNLKLEKQTLAWPVNIPSDECLRNPNELSELGENHDTSEVVVVLNKSKGTVLGKEPSCQSKEPEWIKGEQLRSGKCLDLELNQPCVGSCPETASMFLLVQGRAMKETKEGGISLGYQPIPTKRPRYFFLMFDPGGGAMEAVIGICK